MAPRRLFQTSFGRAHHRDTRVSRAAGRLRPQVSSNFGKLGLHSLLFVSLVPAMTVVLTRYRFTLHVSARVKF